MQTTQLTPIPSASFVPLGGELDPDVGPVEVLTSPENIEEAVSLELLDTLAPGFLIEGVCCQAMIDVNLSMQALAEWTPGEDITYLASAQATCRIAAMAINDVRHVTKGYKRMKDPRHTAFRRMCELMAKRLTKLEPCGPDVESENDIRVCQSIKTVCKFLQYGNIALDTKSSGPMRKLAVKEFGQNA